MAKAAGFVLVRAIPLSETLHLLKYHRWQIVSRWLLLLLTTKLSEFLGRPEAARKALYYH